MIAFEIRLKQSGLKRFILIIIFMTLMSLLLPTTRQSKGQYVFHYIYHNIAPRGKKVVCMKLIGKDFEAEDLRIGVSAHACS